jgi:hypothetical protein
MTLGMNEVHVKRVAWKQKTAGDLTKFLAAHMAGLKGEPI